MNTLLQPSQSTNYSPLMKNTTNRSISELKSSALLPQDLRGTLYRNGPGIFKRGNAQKQNLLDGDGIVQRLHFEDRRVFYSRRFVETPKYKREEEQDQFLYPTWTTKASNPLANFGDEMLSQAGVTVYNVHGKIFALDEVSPGFEVDSSTLSTVGIASLGLPDNDSALKAHARHIAETDEWIFASTRMSSKGMMLDFSRHHKSGKVSNTPTVKLPRRTYVHDFGATRNYAVVILHAVDFQPLSYLSGLKSFTGALRWKSSLGNLVVAVDLNSGNYKIFEADSAWSWHIANVYENSQGLALDFIGYDDADHFLGPDSQLTEIMNGQNGKTGAPGTLRRYELNMRTGSLSEKCLLNENLEFPSVMPNKSGSKHDKIFVTKGSKPGVFHTGIASFTITEDKLDTYDFGNSSQVGEPIFAPNPHKPGHGWLITQVLETISESTNFFVFDALNLSAGPIANLSLGEPMPISFHGHWTPDQ